MVIAFVVDVMKPKETDEWYLPGNVRRRRRLHLLSYTATGSPRAK
jgi:hypothetical protein